MTSKTPEPTRIPATTGVQPGAPNAARADDGDLADGPPAVDEVVEVETTDEARHPSAEEAAALEAGGELADREPDGAIDIEGPNSA